MKKLMNLQGVKTLGKKEQQSINGGVKLPFCNNLGDTGQTCSTHSDCLGAGDPVCFRGCCNTAV